MEKCYYATSAKNAFAIIEQKVGKIRFCRNLNLERLIDNDEFAGSKIVLGQVEVIDEDGDENLLSLDFIPLTAHCADEDYRCIFGKPHTDLCGILEIQGVIWVDVCEHQSLLQ